MFIFAFMNISRIDAGKGETHLSFARIAFAIGFFVALLGLFVFGILIGFVVRADCCPSLPSPPPFSQKERLWSRTRDGKSPDYKDRK